jgi:hypothetical protein
MYRDAIELRSYFDFYMEDDWDGDGAIAVTPLTLHNAKVILASLPVELQKGSAMAGTDGSIGMYWTDGESGIHCQLYIDLRADGRIRFSYSNAVAKKEDVLPKGTSIPELLIHLEPAFSALSITR